MYHHTAFLYYFILLGGPLIAKGTDGRLTVVGILREGEKVDCLALISFDYPQFEIHSLRQQIMSTL